MSARYISNRHHRHRIAHDTASYECTPHATPRREDGGVCSAPAGGMELLETRDINLGITYAAFGAIIPDVAGSRGPHQPTSLCGFVS